MEHRRRRLSSAIDDDDFDTHISIDKTLDIYTKKLYILCSYKIINLIRSCFRKHDAPNNPSL